MAEIIYFGTKGCSGHCPIGIDKMLTKKRIISFQQNNLKCNKIKGFIYN